MELPNVDIDINVPKIVGGIDIKGPKIGGPSLDVDEPKIDAGLVFHGPKMGLPNVGICNIDINDLKIGGRLKIFFMKIV